MTKYQVIVRVEYSVDIEASEASLARDIADRMNVEDFDFENDREIVYVMARKDD